MIDDRRLLKPANEKTKQKNTEIFPPMSTYNYSYTTTQNKKINSKKTYKWWNQLAVKETTKKINFEPSQEVSKNLPTPETPFQK